MTKRQAKLLLYHIFCTNFLHTILLANFIASVVSMVRELAIKVTGAHCQRLQ